MGLRILVSIWFTWLLAILLFALVPLVHSQIQVCSMQNIDLGPCFQGNGYRPDACCNALNQVIHTGFSCMCSLLVSSLPLATTPISLPLPNCYISLPPLSLCRVLAPMPVVIPPVRSGNQHLAPPLTPDDDQMQSSLSNPGDPTQQPAPPLPPADDQMQSSLSSPGNLTQHPVTPLAAVFPSPLLPPAEDQMIQSPLDTTGESNSTAVQKQPCSAENAEPKLDLFGGGYGTANGGEETKVLMIGWRLLFPLVILLHGTILLG
ncbi:hypothetical protein SLE2022_257800 [Rubroshorea leprosula]